MSILDEIVAGKRREVASLREDGYFDSMRRRLPPSGSGRDFAGALKARSEVALIAEIKKASPSRGVIRADLDPAETAVTYAGNGAATISVLTEKRYFHGDPAYLAAVRRAVDVPLLRKDFIVDPDQVIEAAALGADAVLLIVAILPQADLKALLALAADLGLQCLVEVHNEEELARALSAGAGIIGINNRDLKTFRTDLDVTRRLAPLVPGDCTVVAESGIFTAEDVAKVGMWGADAVLVGEALVREADIGARVRDLAGVPRGVINPRFTPGVGRDSDVARGIIVPRPGRDSA